MELTKEIADKIKKEKHLKGFIDKGYIGEEHWYRGLRIHPRFSGQDVYFTIMNDGQIVFTKNKNEVSFIISKLNPDYKQCLLYAD